MVNAEHDRVVKALVLRRTLSLLVPGNSTYNKIERESERGVRIEETSTYLISFLLFIYHKEGGESSSLSLLSIADHSIPKEWIVMGSKERYKVRFNDKKGCTLSGFFMDKLSK